MAVFIMAEQMATSKRAYSESFIVHAKKFLSTLRLF